MAKILRSPLLGAALAAALASTTGYCVLRTGPTEPPPPIMLLPEPMVLAPEVIEPFPIDPLPGLEVRSAPLPN